GVVRRVRPGAGPLAVPAGQGRHRYGVRRLRARAHRLAPADLPRPRADPRAAAPRLRRHPRRRPPLRPPAAPAGPLAPLRRRGPLSPLRPGTRFVPTGNTVGAQPGTRFASTGNSRGQTLSPVRTNRVPGRDEPCRRSGRTVSPVA